MVFKKSDQNSNENFAVIFGLLAIVFEQFLHYFFFYFLMIIVVTRETVILI